MMDSRTLEPPRHLLSLPLEILTHIIGFLPQTSAARVSTCHSILREAAEPCLWRVLWLQQPCGLVLPLDPDDPTAPFLDEETMAARREVFRDAARVRTMELLAQATARPVRLTYVQTINATLYRYMTHHVVSFLYLVSERLATLRLLAAPRYVEYATWGPQDGIFAKLSDFHASFPLLTTLELVPCHNASPRQILRTLALMPNLVKLRIAPRDELRHHGHESSMSDPDLPVWTALKTLVLDFHEDQLPPMCSQILAHSPNLEKVTLRDLWGDLGDDSVSDIGSESEDQHQYLSILAQCQYLIYLEWTCGSWRSGRRFFGMKLDGFSSLRTLVVAGDITSEDQERFDVRT